MTQQARSSAKSRHEFVERLHDVFQFLGYDTDLVSNYVADLQESRLVGRIAARTQGVSEFSKARLEDIEAFHLFRTFLYTLVRYRKPDIYLETGVLHGFGSAFILQALEHNGKGRLVSIDLPHVDGQFLQQGSSLLPAGKQAGWAIPDELRYRHDMRLGQAEYLLPAYFLSEPKPDIFMHDSDHSYRHMMFEMSMAIKHLAAGSIIVVDNIEANESFSDFCRGAGCRSIEVVSFPPEHPEFWLHGVAVV